MSDTDTTTRFDASALAALPRRTAATGAIRERAFARFGAMPLPSKETEEWRYTDVSDLVFDHVALLRGRRRRDARRRPRWRPRGGGRRGRPRRSAAPAQRRRDDHAPRQGSRRCGGALRRPRPRSERAPRSGRGAPAQRRADRPDEVHGAARGVPDRRHVPLRPARRAGRASDPDADVPRCRRRRRVPAHAADRGPWERGHLHRPVCLTGPRASALRRRRRDRGGRRRPREVHRPAGLGDRGAARRRDPRSGRP